MPASEDAAYRAVCALLEAVWETDPTQDWVISTESGDKTIKGIPIQFPNRPDIRQQGRRGTTDKPFSWARFRWQPATGRESIGQTSALQEGLITLEIHVPAGKGMTIANALVTVARSAFLRKSFPGGGCFYEFRTREVGQVEGVFYRKDFQAKYQFNEVV